MLVRAVTACYLPVLTGQGCKSFAYPKAGELNGYETFVTDLASAYPSQAGDVPALAYAVAYVTPQKPCTAALVALGWPLGDACSVLLPLCARMTREKPCQ